jgi:hypothetical protein
MRWQFVKHLGCWQQHLQPLRWVVGKDVVQLISGAH